MKVIDRFKLELAKEYLTDENYIVMLQENELNSPDSIVITVVDDDIIRFKTDTRMSSSNSILLRVSKVAHNSKEAIYLKVN